MAEEREREKICFLTRQMKCDVDLCYGLRNLKSAKIKEIMVRKRGRRIHASVNRSLWRLGARRKKNKETRTKITQHSQRGEKHRKGIPSIKCSRAKCTSRVARAVEMKWRLCLANVSDCFSRICETHSAIYKSKGQLDEEDEWLNSRIVIRSSSSILFIKTDEWSIHCFKNNSKRQLNRKLKRKVDK